MAIKILHKSIVEKIAAGEVVERPYSVIKELIENSIDANATKIDVEIDEGGLKKIRVSDNGVGMNEDDAPLCFSLHATSKINEDEDLFKIATLGFRGEALSSISAVSKVTLKTRHKDSDTGILIINKGGEILETAKLGKTVGTTFIVEDFFYNVPARLKFLSRPSSEATMIGSIILKYILARPDIAFSFVSNNKEVYKSLGDGNLKNAIFSVYGAEFLENLIPIEYSYSDIQIDGFIGLPSIARVSKLKQNLFVNKRYIKNDDIASAIKQSYLNRLMPAKNPVFIVNLTIPYTKLDVNVHPNKLDVRFEDSRLIYECFFKAGQRAFENYEKNTRKEPSVNTEQSFPQDSFFSDKGNQPIQADNIVKPQEIKQETDIEINKEIINFANNNENIIIKEDSAKNIIEAISSKVSVLEPREDSFTMRAPNPDFLLPKKPGNIIVNSLPGDSNIQEVTIIKEDTKKVEETPSSQLDLFYEDLDYKIVGQLFNTYIIIESNEDWYIIDQHAAHERINTEILKEQVKKGAVPKQQLLIPIIIDLTQGETQILEDNKEEFLELGFEVEAFGDNSFRINTVPIVFGEGNVKKFFFDTLDLIKSNAKLETRKGKIFQSACKHSIKAGQVLNNHSIELLIKESKKSDSPYYCPHGRPIVIRKNKKEIEKWFMRIV